MKYDEVKTTIVMNADKPGSRIMVKTFACDVSGCQFEPSLRPVTLTAVTTVKYLNAVY